MLMILTWLGRIFDDFTIRTGRHGTAPTLTVAPVERDDNRRFDPRVIHTALNAQRQKRGLTWHETAQEIGLINAGNLTRLARGGRLGVPRVLYIADWLECAPEALTTTTDW